MLHSPHQAPDVFDLGRTMLWMANALKDDHERETPFPIERPICRPSGAAVGGEGKKAAVAQAGGGEGKKVAAAQVGGKREDVAAAMSSNSPIQPVSALEKLRSYDPCLMLLLQWMTEPKQQDRADMMDVLRHP
jgi:hypothetical protein